METDSHLGKFFFERLQHVVHGAFAVLPRRHAHHRLAVHGDVARLHSQLRHTNGITHGLCVDLENRRKHNL